MKQINFSRGNDFIQLLVDVTETILSQYSIYMPPLKKTREPEVSWRFQGVWKWNIGLKWVKYNKKITGQSLANNLTSWTGIFTCLFLVLVILVIDI